MIMTSSPAGPRPWLARLPWALVLGLAALALLWPLISLTGLRVALGDGPASGLVIICTAALWIGVVGLGRVPAPIRTLTVVGLIHGVITQLTSILVIELGPVEADRPLWTVLPALLLNVLWGFLAGVAAAGVQRLT